MHAKKVVSRIVLLLQLSLRERTLWTQSLTDKTKEDCENVIVEGRYVRVLAMMLREDQFKFGTASMCLDIQGAERSSASNLRLSRWYFRKSNSYKHSSSARCLLGLCCCHSNFLHFQCKSLRLTSHTFYSTICQSTMPPLTTPAFHRIIITLQSWDPDCWIEFQIYFTIAKVATTYFTFFLS